jgi:ubiquinone/menaquinone biosynthesis C-methylase UbiE
MVGTMANFGGSIPEYYDSIMGPAQFEAYGAELAARLPANPGGDVLEIATGTGRVTRHLRERLDSGVKLVASDLSLAMLEVARKRLGAARNIEFHEADACKLPFKDAGFAAVVCAFGVMFVPDKPAAFREARRVLRKGGTWYFNVWDGLENNPHGRSTAEIMEALDPALKGGAMPYLFNDRGVIERLLVGERFEKPRFEVVRIACTCPSARDFATGQIRGTPRGQLLQQKGIDVDAIIDQAAAALAKVGGSAPFKYTAQALVIEARAA